MLITNYGYGGAQRVFAQLVDGLSRNHTVIKVVFNNHEDDVYPSEGKSISLEINAGVNLVSKCINFLHRCRKLYKLKKKYNPQYTISHLEGANYVNVLSQGCGSSILCVHGSKTAKDSNRKGIIKFIENKILTPILYNRAYRVVTVSQGIVEELASVFRVKRQKLFSIQNGVDIERIQQLSTARLNHQEKQFFKKTTMVFLGRLAPQKNPLALIDIYSRLENRNEVNLLIIGDGFLKDNMLKRCRALGLSYRDGLNDEDSPETEVTFIGFCTNPFRLLRHATLFVLTSDHEGFPLAPCEAMVLGLPVVATDCPVGVREILAPTTEHHYISKLRTPEVTPFGILMPLLLDDASVELWANEISTRIFDEEWLRSASALSKKRANELSLESCHQKWLALLSDHRG